MLRRHPNLIYYKRYIDDVFGAWTPSQTKEEDDENWAEFQRDLNDFHDIEWIITSRSTSVNFLDLTITISNGVCKTTLFEKLLNLYLYISPSSAHPPGVLTGLVLGNCHRIFTLCSDPGDTKSHLQQFYRRLRKRGYKPSNLLPLFQRAAHLHHIRTRNPPPSVETLLDDDAEYPGKFPNILPFKVQ